MSQWWNQILKIQNPVAENAADCPVLSLSLETWGEMHLAFFIYFFLHCILERCDCGKQIAQHLFSGEIYITMRHKE